MEQDVQKVQIVEDEGARGNAPAEQVINNNSLRKDLMDCYNQLREGKIGLREAKEYANMAGKIISSAKAQLDYNVTIGKPDKTIEFFEE